MKKNKNGDVGENNDKRIIMSTMKKKNIYIKASYHHGLNSFIMMCEIDYKQKYKERQQNQYYERKC